MNKNGVIRTTGVFYLDDSPESADWIKVTG